MNHDSDLRSWKLRGLSQALPAQGIQGVARLVAARK